MHEKIYIKYHFGYATLTKPEVPEFQTGGSGCKTGYSGFKHLSGQNRKFRFLKPTVPVSAGHWRTVRSKEPDRPRLDFDAATVAQRRHGRVPAAEQGRSGPKEARTGCSTARRSSPWHQTARNGDEAAARRRGAAAGGVARRGLCAAMEEAG